MTVIEKVGQKYLDEPIVVRPTASRIAKAVAVAINPEAPPRDSITVGHERVELKWVKPDLDYMNFDPTN